MGAGLRGLVLAGFAAVVLAACGDGGGSADEVSAADLDGTTYGSTKVTGHDLVEGTTVSLTFEDGRLSVQAGCNTMGAAYEVEDGTLRWTSPAASTMMACSDDLSAQDTWLTGLFTDGVDAELAGDTLTLTSGDVGIELTAAG